MISLTIWLLSQGWLAYLISTLYRENYRLKFDNYNLKIEIKWLQSLNPRPIGGFKMYFIINGTRMDKMNLKVSQTLPMSVVAEDEFNNPVGALASPAWTVVDPTLGTIVASDDGQSATFTPSGKLGTTQIQVLVNDGKVINGSLDVVLIPGDATQVVIQAGTPVDATA